MPVRIKDFRCIVELTSGGHTKYPVVMANPKHTIHIGVAAVGIVAGAILAVLVGDPTVALIFSGGAMSGIGYWLGAAAQRRHG
jgi:hypothetical protein